MATFRKKPVEVEAYRWYPSARPEEQTGVGFDEGSNSHFVVTIHGQKAYLSAGDWVITESDGTHHYPCKDEVFRSTYESTDVESWVELCPTTCDLPKSNRDWTKR